MPNHPQDEPRVVRSEDIPVEERERRIARTLRAIDAMPDEDIDCSDIPETTDWSNAIRGWFSNDAQVEIRLRIDRGTLRWIIREHGEFQAAINDVLTGHVMTQRRESLRQRREAEDAGESGS